MGGALALHEGVAIPGPRLRAPVALDGRTRRRIDATEQPAADRENPGGEDPRERVVAQAADAVAARDGDRALEVRGIAQKGRHGVLRDTGQNRPAGLLHGEIVERQADAGWREDERDPRRI